MNGSFCREEETSEASTPGSSSPFWPRASARRFLSAGRSEPQRSLSRRRSIRGRCEPHLTCGVRSDPGEVFPISPLTSLRALRGQGGVLDAAGWRRFLDHNISFRFDEARTASHIRDRFETGSSVTLQSGSVMGMT